ncbi:MAG: fluoride efflux transporter FluC [Wenzhouxiangella sp.]
MGLVLFTALGSVVGGLARFGLGLYVDRRVGVRFPWSTLLVNLSGSFAIGVGAALALSAGAGPQSWMASFWITGFLGSYTTVSAFSMQTLMLYRQRGPGSAAINVGISVAGGLFAAMAGWILGGGVLV